MLSRSDQGIRRVVPVQKLRNQENASIEVGLNVIANNLIRLDNLLKPAMED